MKEQMPTEKGLPRIKTVRADRPCGRHHVGDADVVFRSGTGRIKDSQVSVAVPWGTSSYAACNGFHPLYRALFEGASRLTYNVIDEQAFGSYLEREEGALQFVANAIREFREARERRGRETTGIGQERADHIGDVAAWSTSEIPGDIEFHHTSPLTDCVRPFIFHCESFLPIFMPFSYQGEGFRRSPETLRLLYGKIFRSKGCLGIFSHIPETLDHFRQFFQSPDIDGKLRISRIGIAESALSVLSAEKNAIPGRITFLFTSSAHQNPVSFGLRGGFAVLRFAIALLRSGRASRFILRSARPCDKDLEEAGVDVRALKEYEGSKIIWLERFLTEREQLRLFVVADILLLPSANLHSVTIMQGLAAGAVPVVTDTLGPDQFVKDGKTGIVLKGVREAIWERDEFSGVPVDRHARFAKLTPRLAKDMYGRITKLLEEDGRLLAMQEAGRADARARFQGAAFAEEFEGAVCGLWDQYSRANTISGKRKHVFSTKELLLDKSKHSRLFESAPQPLAILETPHAYVYRIRDIYAAVQKPTNIRAHPAISVFGLRQPHEFQQEHICVGTSFMDVSGVLFPMERGSRAGVVLRAIETFAYTRLRKYPRLYTPLKVSYNRIRRASRMMNTPPSGEYKAGLDWAATTLSDVDKKQTWARQGILHTLDLIRRWRDRAMRGGGMGRATYRLARLPFIGMRKICWGIAHHRRGARNRRPARRSGL